ncbi:MAG: Ig domain-containing protein [Roseburia sp.]|nr:Ig domain-containing protein [Roseburia sp.]
MRKMLAMISLCLSVLLVIPVVVPDNPVGVTIEAATKVKMSKSKATLIAGKTLQLKLKGAKGKISWNSSKKSVATVSKKGKVTAKKKGTATITAKNQGKKYTCKITVKKAVPLKSITLNKSNVTLEVDDYTVLKVKYNPSNTTVNKKVVWTSSNENIAEVDEDGYVYANNPGIATVTAKVDGKKAACQVTVTEPVIEVGSISLNLSTLQLNEGESSVLTATVSPYNATDKTVMWVTSNAGVATVKDGVVSAVAPGTAIITAMAGNKKATCSVTVNKVNTVADNVETLKNYIDKNGTLNSKGNRFIKRIDINDGYTYTEGIVHELQTDKLCFIYSSESADSNSAITMYVDNNVASPQYTIVFTNYYLAATAEATFDASQYSKNDTVYFELLSGVGLNEADIQKVANAELKVAFSGWELLLYQKLGFRLKDIGFTEY